MSDDLAFAKATIDWAEGNLPFFEDRAQRWLDSNMDIRIENIEANPTHNLAILFEKEPFPLSFSVEAGAYINAIRSSLDILATVLAKRHSVTGINEVYFPVASSKAEFISRGFKGSKFVNQLPPSDLALIETLEPYKGGNDTLWFLHRLDIMRKHRRLLEVDVRPLSIHISLLGRGPGITPVGGKIGANGETALAFVPKRASKHNIQVTPIIAIDETIIQGPWPLFILQRKFIDLARDIIARFDIS